MILLFCMCGRGCFERDISWTLGVKLLVKNECDFVVILFSACFVLEKSNNTLLGAYIYCYCLSGKYIVVDCNLRYIACCWWKGFQNGILIFLRGIWGLRFNWQSKSYNSSQVHVDEQDHAKQVLINIYQSAICQLTSPTQPSIPLKNDKLDAWVTKYWFLHLYEEKRFPYKLLCSLFGS